MKYIVRFRFEESQPQTAKQWGVYPEHAEGSNLGYCVFSSTSMVEAAVFCKKLNS